LYVASATNVPEAPIVRMTRWHSPLNVSLFATSTAACGDQGRARQAADVQLDGQGVGRVGRGRDALVADLATSPTFSVFAGI
jgi:hypothetical protein